MIVLAAATDIYIYILGVVVATAVAVVELVSKESYSHQTRISADEMQQAAGDDIEQADHQSNMVRIQGSIYLCTESLLNGVKNM